MKEQDLGVVDEDCSRLYFLHDYFRHYSHTSLVVAEGVYRDHSRVVLHSHYSHSTEDRVVANFVEDGCMNVNQEEQVVRY